MKNQGGAQTSKVNLVLVLLLGFSEAHAEVSSNCAKKGFIDAAKEIVFLAASGQDVSNQPAPVDRRRKVSDLLSRKDEVSQMLVEASAGVVAITSVEAQDYVTNRETNERESLTWKKLGRKASGIFVGSQCHILSARHVANLFTSVVRGDGKVIPVVDDSKRTIGNRLSMTSGLADGKLQQFSGRVIQEGASPRYTGSDYIVIRTDRKIATAVPLALAPVTAEQLRDRPMAMLGFPSDFNRSEFKTMVADPDCQILSSHTNVADGVRGFKSTCIGTRGSSGGPLLAKVRIETSEGGGQWQEAWQVVGIAAGLLVPDSGSVALEGFGTSLQAGPVEFVPFEGIARDVAKAVLDDLAKNPCQ